MTPPEYERLERLESVVDTGLKTFHEVGAALLEIRDSRLYRESHTTFELYCRERWDMTGRHANRLIKAAAVAEQLGPIGPVPENEGQVRALTKIPEGRRSVVLELAHAESQRTGKPITAGMLTRIGDVLAEAALTAHVDTGSGLSNPVTVAVSATEVEATRRQAGYQRDHYEKHDSQGKLTADERARRLAVAAAGEFCPKCNYPLKGADHVSEA